MLRKTLLVLQALCLAGFLHAADDVQPYEVLDAPLTPNTVTVYFSFSCSGCYKLEKKLKPYLKTKGKIQLQYVPLMFHSSWRAQTQAFYIAKHYRVFNSFSSMMFKAIHLDAQDNLDTVAGVAPYLIKAGVPEKDAQLAFYSLAVKLAIKRDHQFAFKHQIMVIPTVVIHGRYLVSPDTVDGDEEVMVSAIDNLINHPPKTTG